MWFGNYFFLSYVKFTLISASDVLLILPFSSVEGSISNKLSAERINLPKRDVDPGNKIQFCVQCININLNGGYLFLEHSLQTVFILQWDEIK